MLAWLLPLLFSAPWLAAIVWFLLRSPRGAVEASPSMSELVRQRLWTS